MDTNEARLAELERRLAELPDPDIESVEEMARVESVRFAEAFGQPQPTFRTSLRVRFFGPGVEGHDLRGEIAGDVIKRLVDAVSAAGAKMRDASPQALQLFLSPTVSPGSTVLELYGRPRPAPSGMSTLGGEILDTPVDAAIGVLFSGLDSVRDEPEAAEPAFDGALGKPLFRLAKDLLDGDVDLDLLWQRPRGAKRAVRLDRSRARRLRDLLDRDTTQERVLDGMGELVSLSTDGKIGIRLTGAKRVLPIAANNVTESALRDLWAKQVHARWRETTISHPQRDTSTTTNELLSIEEIPTGVELHGEGG